LSLPDDGKHVNLVLYDIVENPDFSNAQPVLRLPQSAQPFDPALAHLPRFMSEMKLDLIPYFRPNTSVKAPHDVDRFRREDDLEAQNMARL